MNNGNTRKKTETHGLFCVFPFLSCLFLSLFLSQPACAQSRHERLHRVDSVLTSRYYNAPIDSNYIVRPEGKITLKASLKVSGNGIHARSTLGGNESKAHLKTDPRATIALAVSYRGVAAALSLNPSSVFGKKTDYEFNVNLSSRRFSVDASYQDSKTLAGEVHSSKETYLERGYAHMKVVNIAAYYTFNSHRFSFPAAFNQSYIQRRSAGSWLAGLSYQGGTIKTSDSAPATAPQIRIEADHIGIGGGYGYNLVVRDRWLFHASMVPTVVIYNHNKLVVNGEERTAERMRLNMIFNERMAVIYYFPSRYFVGATAVMNNSIFDDKVVILNQNKWLFRAFVGMRL